eukprot:gnl/Chilomastix_cuspidata/4468.p1 GENE.gnl/Chilomastix_cuspidata/4468~~gnl/Chilomastix_cuspidata/4468.p1  ORF type:complete len:592 (-),score=256.07 gnl/Chilomastix_cuspidata/4468:25-1800(-)
MDAGALALAHALDAAVRQVTQSEARDALVQSCGRICEFLTAPTPGSVPLALVPVPIDEATEQEVAEQIKEALLRDGVETITVRETLPYPELFGAAAGPDAARMCVAIRCGNTFSPVVLDDLVVFLSDAAAQASVLVLHSSSPALLARALLPETRRRARTKAFAVPDTLAALDSAFERLVARGFPLLPDAPACALLQRAVSRAEFEALLAAAITRHAVHTPGLAGRVREFAFGAVALDRAALAQLVETRPMAGCQTRGADLAAARWAVFRSSFALCQELLALLLRASGACSSGAASPLRVFRSAVAGEWPDLPQVAELRAHLPKMTFAQLAAALAEARDRITAHHSGVTCEGEPVTLAALLPHTLAELARAHAGLTAKDEPPQPQKAPRRRRTRGDLSQALSLLSGAPSRREPAAPAPYEGAFAGELRKREAKGTAIRLLGGVGATAGVLSALAPPLSRAESPWAAAFLLSVDPSVTASPRVPLAPAALQGLDAPDLVLHCARCTSEGLGSGFPDASLLFEFVQASEGQVVPLDALFRQFWDATAPRYRARTRGAVLHAFDLFKRALGALRAMDILAHAPRHPGCVEVVRVF